MRQIKQSTLSARERLLKAIRKKPDSTIRELQAAAAISSPSVVDYHLTKMMAAGILRKINCYEIIGHG